MPSVTWPVFRKLWIPPVDEGDVNRRRDEGRWRLNGASPWHPAAPAPLPSPLQAPETATLISLRRESAAEGGLETRRREPLAADGACPSAQSAAGARDGDPRPCDVNGRAEGGGDERNPVSSIGVFKVFTEDLVSRRVGEMNEILWPRLEFSKFSRKTWFL